MKKRARRGGAQRQRYWEDVLRRWQEGGLSVRAFCRGEGVPESAFYFWRKKRSRRERLAEGKAKRAMAAEATAAPTATLPVLPRPAARPGARPLFLPVKVIGHEVPEAGRAVEIVLANGCIVRVPPGFDRRTLADVLAVLETRPC